MEENFEVKEIEDIRFIDMTTGEEIMHFDFKESEVTPPLEPKAEVEEKLQYVVFDDGGHCALDYGGAQEYFDEYEDAYAYAQERLNKIKDLPFWSVRIYIGQKHHGIGVYPIPNKEKCLYYIDHDMYAGL